ncbi:MAG: hypothetical protein JNK87_04785 [Bryobacterales bacterium]|nr:hypothetical protein [Bryobacterales bacterium]
MTFRAVFVLAVAGVAMFGADWKEGGFPQWPENKVLKLLTDSPWSKPRTVPLQWHKQEDRPFTYKDVPGADHSQNRPGGGTIGGSPVGGIGKAKPKLPDQADLIVRWASALPVRQAVALYKQRDENLDAGKLPELVGPAATDYVVEIFGTPAMLAHRGVESVEAVVRNGTVLKSKSGRTWKPSRVKVTTNGDTLGILIYFPRTPAITATDKELEFSADLQILRVEERFKLGAMQYGGALEL